MKSEKNYHCPVCKARFGSRQGAIDCRNSHRIIESEWCTCEICGQGWKCNYFGYARAAVLAKECEEKHRQKGEEREVMARNYFYSGGAVGKSYVISNQTQNIRSLYLQELNITRIKGGER